MTSGQKQHNLDRHPRGESGFVLVEVLAAFTVAALSLIIIYQLLGQWTQAARSVRVKTEALTIAKSKLAAVGHETPLRIGTDNGPAPKGYRWELEISPYGSGAVEQDSRIRAYWVDVTVFREGEKRSNPIINLRTLKLGPP